LVKLTEGVVKSRWGVGVILKDRGGIKKNAKGGDGALKNTRRGGSHEGGVLDQKAPVGPMS